MSFGINALNKDQKENDFLKDKKIDNYIEEKKQIKEERISSQFEKGVVIADFVAALYRPKPRRGGFLAQFFGENGPYADTIVGLHFTRFQDVYVKVSVWVLKDKNGAVLLRNNSQPPVTEFMAKIERPSPSKEGQTALFFGKDGEDADAINVLSRSEFLDALVYVQIQLAEEDLNVDDIETIAPQDLEDKVHIMTKEEKKEFDKKQKFYKDCNLILRNQGFFRNSQVMKKLFTVEEMRDFVKTKPCCCRTMKNACNTGDHQIMTYQLGLNDYSYIPLCKTHYDKLNNGEEIGIKGVENEFSSFSDHYNNLLTTEKLKVILKLNEDEEIPPSRLREWCIKNDLYSLLPNKYLHHSEIREYDR